MPRDPLEALRLPVVPIEPRPQFASALLRLLQGVPEPPPRRQGATVRYFVDDLDRAVDFYVRALGFEEELRPGPTFAMLYRGDLRLLLSVPGEPHALPDGTLPRPGGFNRMSLRVSGLPAAVAELRRHGTRLATPITPGPAVNTILVRDPAGNLVELFEPRGAAYHERPAPDEHPESHHPEEGAQ
jgi:catechol 2,3-dioxygenase-like lactoylglutathione lyase family enzyme